MENTGTTEGSAKPPAGYKPCPKKCGRWTDGAGLVVGCWMCFGHPGKSEGSVYPDWTPPIAAPAHVERRKGQRWKMSGPRGFIMEGTLADAGENGIGMRWTLVDAVRNDGAGTSGNCFYFKHWEETEYTMTLLHDAPADPSGAGEVAMKVPALGWCKSCGCGHGGPRGYAHLASCSASKAPPTQEAPKQWRDVMKCGATITSDNREAGITAVGKHKARCTTCEDQEAACSYGCSLPVISSSCPTHRQTTVQEAPKAAPVCCRIGGELSKENRRCPTHWKAPAVDLSFMLTDFDLLRDA